MHKQLEDRITYLDGEFTKYNEPVIDELVMHSAMVHLESLSDSCYMLIMNNGKHHWHLTIHSKSGKANVVARIYESNKVEKVSQPKPDDKADITIDVGKLSHPPFTGLDIEPDPSGLLSDEELAHLWVIYLQECNTGIKPTTNLLKQVAEAQRDLTASLVRAECEAEWETRFCPDYLNFKEGVRAGRELERARTIKEVESIATMGNEYWNTLLAPTLLIRVSDFQALKKGEMPE